MLTHKPFNKNLDENFFESCLRKRGDESPIDFSFFPPTGFVIFSDETPVCLGFMIKCDNHTCINTDIVSDPDVDSEIRHEAVKYLRDVLQGEAERCGIPFIMAMTDQPKLVARLKEQGYKIITENVTTLGRPTWL